MRLGKRSAGALLRLEEKHGTALYATSTVQLVDGAGQMLALEIPLSEKY
jgi:hypothetical protein